MKWIKVSRHVDLGFLPMILRDDDPRPVNEQMDDRYAHGGGWRPQGGFKFDFETGALKYPGDPPMYPVAMTRLHDDMIIIYPYAYMLVRHKDGSWQVMRAD